MAIRCIDPIKFQELCWPDLSIYDKQREIIYSVRDNDVTVVPAGNALGKDFIAAFIVLWFFVSRRPARVVTTSVKGDQLSDVLWAEIRRFLDTSKYRLPIAYNHLLIRQLRGDGTLEPRSSLTGQVVQKGESLLGRHLERTDDGLPRTLAVFDEASGIEDAVYQSATTWAHRILVISNCYPCTNFFYKAVKEGDQEGPPGYPGKYRKVIRIKAEHSPNVQLALKEIAEGKQPSNKTIIPGVVDYQTYVKRRRTWDKRSQCIGLDADFWEGSEDYLFPVEWLNLAETYGDTLPQRRKGVTMGVDSAAGGDNTAFAVCDRFGLIDLQSLKTPDTSVIAGRTLALMQEYQITPDNVLFDAGGGGKQHADYLREKGYNVRTVAFGESVTPPRKRGMTSLENRIVQDEERYVYKNRRAEMYGLLRLAIDPSEYGQKGRNPFGLPSRFSEQLRHQLALIPLRFDGEGRMYLPPKHKRDPNSTEQSLVDIIGHSPDEADALVLARYGLVSKARRTFIQLTCS